METTKYNIYFYLKRLFDFSVSIILFILLIPVSIIAIISIKLTIKGSPLFVQKRTGLNGKNFNLYKFKTMARKQLPGGKTINVPTKLGAIIRSLSIDEIPQFINVIKGDMSIVGPRPWITDYYKHMSSVQRLRTSIRPGITGLAQASGRNSLSIFEKISYDLAYVESMSFKLDSKIIIKTILQVIKRESVDISEQSIEDEINALKKHKVESSGQTLEERTAGANEKALTHI